MPLLVTCPNYSGSINKCTFCESSLQSFDKLVHRRKDTDMLTEMTQKKEHRLKWFSFLYIEISHPVFN